MSGCKNDQMNKQIIRFVEDLGSIFASSGLSRSAGRILGWLTICNPPEQSTNELVEALDITKATVSTATRLLIGFGLIERFHKRGSREWYFKMRPNAWIQILSNRLKVFRQMRELANQGIKAVGRNNVNTKRLREMRDTYKFFEKEFPILLKRFEKERGK